jgi:lipoprotein-anchoring transpeptidase ErfK/SrfK
MYFSGGEALHGSPDNTLVEDNISHGCVRLRIADAEWLRYNFVSVGTKVVVKPY